MECLRFGMRSGHSSFPSLYSMPETLRRLSSPLICSNGFRYPPAVLVTRHRHSVADASGVEGNRSLSSTLVRNMATATLAETSVLAGGDLAENPVTGEIFNEKLFNTRSQLVSTFSGADLAHTKQWWYGNELRSQAPPTKVPRSTVQPSDMLTENVFGLSRMSVGVTGPLLVRGKHVNGYSLVPYATTEGALIASASRGALALSRAGGSRCVIQRDVVHTSPVLRLHSLDECVVVSEWMQRNKPDIRASVPVANAGVRMIACETKISGHCVYVAMSFDCVNATEYSDATMATEHTVKNLLQRLSEDLPQVSIADYYLNSFLTGDKHIAYYNRTHGQGISVQVECFIPESVLRDVLKVSSETLMEARYHFQQGESVGGNPLTQVNTTNAVAGVFLATGQDVGRINDCAVNNLTVELATAEDISSYQEELRGDHGEFMKDYCTSDVQFDIQGTASSSGAKDEAGVYVSMMMPSLYLRTSEGGCLLPAQRECLQMMRCTGKDGRYRLAEILASSSLGLDLSTLAALGGGQFASAHEKLGRNRPGLGLRKADLTQSFFSEAVADLGELLEVKQSSVDARTSILTDMTKTQLSKFVGHLAFDMLIRNTDGEVDMVPMVMKSKSTDQETCNVLNRLAQGCGLELSEQYQHFKMELGFRNCHVRELEIVRLTDLRFTSISPKTYFIKQDTEKEVLVYFMEHLKGMVHFATADNPVDWTQDDQKLVLSDIAGFHSMYYGKEDELLSKEWIDVRRPADMVEKENLWVALVNHNHREHPEIWTSDICKLAMDIIVRIGPIWQHFEESKRTLVHNDFNPRNLCIRPACHSSSDGRQARLCCYDWELATLHVPQHDVAEFLSFLLSPSSDLEVWTRLTEHHRQALQRATACSIPQDEYQHTFDIAMCDFLINRVALYGMAHTFKDYVFYKRLVAATAGYIQRRLKASHKLAAFIQS